MSGTSQSPSVQRAARLLDVLASGDAHTASELARLLELRLSSVADLCATLADERVVRRRAGGSFVVGTRAESWAGALLAHPQMLRLFAPVIAESGGLTGVTVTLEVLQGSEVLSVATRLGTLPLPSTPRPGLRAAVLDSAAGRAILRATPFDEVQRSFDRYAGHQGLEPGLLTALRADVESDQNGSVHRSVPSGAAQLAAVVPAVGGAASFTALVAHLPEHGFDPAALWSPLRIAADALSTRSVGP